MESIRPRPPTCADPARVAQWRARLRQRSPRHAGPLVGLVWAGLPNLDSWDARRSISAAPSAQRTSPVWRAFRACEFVSLQKHASPPPVAGLEMIDVMAGMDDFADTAALVGALDLVVSVDTAVAHLAAGLGRPVWLLSRYDGCWRWLRDRADTPWYPALPTYRQTRPHHWPEVIARVRHDLEETQRAHCID